MPLVVGVDSSTSTCKVQVRDADTGALLSSGRAAHPPTTPPRSEQDPAAWRQAFDTACEQAGVPGRHRPAAIGVAAQQHGLVVLDTDGLVVRPAKLWNDTESAADAEELLAALPGGPGQWAAACGSVPLPSFTITKLRWLRRCEPGAWRRLATVLLPHDWLNWQLTRTYRTDRGDASGTGYWSPAEDRYRPDLLALVDDRVEWEGALPRVLGPREPAGEWSPVGALVAPGTGDNMASALGLALSCGDLVLSFGTSATAFTVSERPSADPSGAVAGFADATGRFLPLVCTLNATKVADALARLLGVDSAEFARLALEETPGSRGLVLVPHFDGERTPNRPTASGVLSGLRSDLSRGQLARAAVEGVVCNLLAGADALALGDGLTPRRVVVIGGGSRSAAFVRIVADLTGRPVEVPRERELVACGAAVQAAGVLTGRPFEEVAAAWGAGAGDIVEPDGDVDRAGIRAAYADAMARAGS